MKKKNILFDVFDNADDRTLRDLSERCKPVDKRTDRRIFAKIQQKCGDASYEEEVYVLKGVDGNMKKNWRKPAMTAAACLLLVGGVIGGAALLKKGGGSSSNGDSYYTSVDSTGEGTTAPEKKEKTVITAAFIFGITDYEKMVNIFNSGQDDYTIKLVDYHKYDVENGTYGEAAMRQLKIDIAAGDAPDIIFTGDHSLINALGSKGTFADLYSFMENDPEVNRDTLLPNVLKAFESSDGKLYSLAPTYQINTMVVKKKFGQKENWSIDDMIAFFDSAPATADHLYDSVTRGWLLEIIVRGMNELVDYDKAECYFDSDEFVKVLEFCNRFAESQNVPEDKAEADAYWRDKVTWTKLDRSPLYMGMIMGYSGTLESEFSSIKYVDFGGEDFTFVGAPTSDGHGGKIEPLGEFAILDTCSDKNGAWQFVRQFFTKETQANHEPGEAPDYKKAFPIQQMRVRKDCFEEWIEQNKYCYEYSDEEQKWVKTDHTYWEHRDTTLYAPTDEELEDYRRYLLSCDTLDNEIAPDIMSICKEEADAYFHGDCTAKQAAERIQSRCSILLSENA
ncbi:MAG: extracellular solute-binding protein [Ruminococcus sp.]|nr:extracellular solute-binding protein [Ruminococcus sp.]